MRFVIQRVNNAQILQGHLCIAKIDFGLLIYVGIGINDIKIDYNKIVNKILNLRIFEDENKKLNLNINDVDGKVLLISQFTLFGDVSSSNRPSFSKSAKFEEAKVIYYNLYKEFKNKIKTLSGNFGANMSVTYTNVGPVTITLEME